MGRSNLPQHLKAVFSGKHDIQDHQVGRFPVYCIHNGKAVSKRDDLITVTPEIFYD